MSWYALDQTKSSLGVRASILLAVGVILGQTGQGVTLPIFADSIGAAGSTPYFVVWFASLAFVVILGAVNAVMQMISPRDREAKPGMLTLDFQKGPIVIGLCDALNGMMVVFASPSSRTPPYLQALLGNFTVPLTIIVRAALLRKTPRPRQILVAAMVFSGLFVSLIPSIFGSVGSDATGSGSLIWSIWFMLGFLPAVFMNVIEEDSLVKEHSETNVTTFVFWLNFWQLVFVSIFFWVDIVPGYGMSNGVLDWVEHMRNGLACIAGNNGCGRQGVTWGAFFIFSYVLAYVAGALLLKLSEGAVWQAVISTVVGPLGTFWWALFQPQPTFHFAPSWGVKMTYAAVSLVIILPGVFLYRSNGALTRPESETFVQEEYVRLRADVENFV